MRMKSWHAGNWFPGWLSFRNNDLRTTGSTVRWFHPRFYFRRKIWGHHTHFSVGGRGKSSQKKHFFGVFAKLETVAELVEGICGYFFYPLYAKRYPLIFPLTFVWYYVKIPICLPAGKHKPPVGAGYSGEPHVFVSADTRRKSSFVNSLGAKRKPLRGIFNIQ